MGSVAEDAVADPQRRDYSTAADTLVPIWPLAFVLGGVALFAAVMLGRDHRRQLRELSG
jgi:hypothetical protein